MNVTDEFPAPSDSELPDYGLIAPISVSSDGRIPDPSTGASSQGEYERYFRLVRGQPELVEWSRSCLDTQRRVLNDLDRTDLSAEDRCNLMAGCLVVMHSTLENWLKLSAEMATT